MPTFSGRLFLLREHSLRRAAFNGGLIITELQRALVVAD